MRWSGAIQKRGLHGAFIHFCRDIPVSAAWLVDKGFRYKNFSKATIQQLKMRIEVEVKSMNLMTDNSLSNNRSLSADNVQGTAATGNVKAISANLAYKQVTKTPCHIMWGKCDVLKLITPINESHIMADDDSCLVVL